MLWKSDQVKFHPARLANICPLSCVECCLVRPSCHCQRGNTFITWDELVQWWEINCLSKRLCNGGAPWMDLVSWSDFHSPCCAKLLIAIWMGATLKEDSNYPSSSAHADYAVVPFDLFNKGRLPLLFLFELRYFYYHPTPDSLSATVSVAVYAQKPTLKRISFPFYGQRGEERLFTIQQNAIHSTAQQNIYFFTLPMPFWSAESPERKMH